jgi:ribosomal protein S12 methylthiotransferase accessory factor
MTATGTAESASAPALSKLFLRAADGLSGPRAGASLSDDVAGLLQSLEYDSEPETPDVGANRAALLRVAAQFSRVFQLGAPEAPGLVFFGGEVAPSMIAPDHAQAPLTGVGGMGLSMRAAFEACIGEGVEYLSQFEAGDEALVVSSAAEIQQAAKGEGRRFLEVLLPATEAAAHPRLDCLVARALLDDSKMLLPAEICLRRSPGRSRMTPPFLLSMGCAAGPTKADAVLHGLCELVERDAAGLWWRGGMRGRPLALDDPASGDAAVLLAKLRQENASRRTWLLDITTDLGIPAIAAVSCRADGKGFACGLGVRPTVTGAARGAIMELCQSELAHAVVAAKEAESGAEKLNDRDRAHIARATRIDVDTCALLHPLGMPVRREVCAAEDTVSQIGWIATRLAQANIETFVIDLTRPRFAVPVVRVVAPGLHIEPSKLESSRLQRAITATGGGHLHTGGLQLF